MSGRGRGRGAYFRAKYGGGGRGRGGGPAGDTYGQGPPMIDDSMPQAGGTRDWKQLTNDLKSIDGQQYGAYKRLYGKYEHTGPSFTLSVDHVQGDAFASPSRVRAIMPWQQTGLPKEFLQSDIRRIALCDYVTRVCASVIRSKHMDQGPNAGGGGGWSGPKGGAFNINAPGQEVLPRTSAMISSGGETIELRFTTSLPAAGRTVLGQQAWQILAVNVVELVQQSLLYGSLDQAKLGQHVISVENQSALRAQLAPANLIAFVANGAILPRASGASAAPMDPKKAIRFQSPKELEVSFPLPDGSTASGMGVARGITLLTGGGFHGKSTLLEAIQLGIYNHIPGDGRELIVTDPTAVKIRAEDGRAVSSVDISPFIRNLPGGRDTKNFSTDDASGSTSMATNIQEALEVGCKSLLIDEDSSATNLLVRDVRMQALIRNEPIQPLVAKARSLFTQHGVSTVIVIGGLGDWLSVADQVIAMEGYIPRAITAEAKAIVQQYPSMVTEDSTYGSIPARNMQVNLAGTRSPFAMRKGFISMKPQARNPVDDPSEAEAGIDLNGIDQLVEVGQSRTIAVLLEQVAGKTAANASPLATLLGTMSNRLGVENCLPTNLAHGDLVGARPLEFAAALSRMRGVSVNV
ncbi:hypothetical protein KC340_g7941 [Hortaea werneckii]|nr:hypothetical protein KC342_g3487 [Hortaea werneckii]KAI7105595.1 hypothetical protein KC339_g3711 [Hortaea werneckii]KAI7208826.1 hypothetical protein KC365_g15922 [Hortaea werneckii]KAI7319130.1 hypothetical protein KC340_g7941 [Hortaea werneckii]KAI7393315.1 hypothetical protein KC328_g6676 [Hortaea werneckii]